MGVASVHGLIAFHSLGPRIGVVTGQGLMGLIRDRYGPRYGGAALALLVLPNLGTTCAELAGGRWVRAVRHPPLPGGANTAVPIRQLSGRGGLALVIVLLPGMPLTGVLVLTQVLNA